MCHVLLDPANETALGWFEIVCPKIPADDFIESLRLPLLHGYEQSCDIDKRFEVAVEHWI